MQERDTKEREMNYSNIKFEIVSAIEATYTEPTSLIKLDMRNELEAMLAKIKELEAAERQEAIKAARDHENTYTKILSFLANGEKLNAIKFWRLFSGDGLKESKDFIDRIDAAGKVGRRHRPISSPTDIESSNFYAGLVNAMRVSRMAAMAYLSMNTTMDYLSGNAAMSYDDADRFLSNFNRRAGSPFFTN